MPLAPEWNGTARPTQLVAPSMWRESTCARWFTPVAAGTREVDRLAALGGERAQHRVRELEQVGVVDAALGEAQQRRAGADRAARRVALHERVALECRDDARGRALGQIA